jgi:hypothetical protein
MADHRKREQRDRLKDALRENLKRRKAQARGRSEASRVERGPRQDAADRDVSDDKADHHRD